MALAWSAVQQSAISGENHMSSPSSFFPTSEAGHISECFEKSSQNASRYAFSPSVAASMFRALAVSRCTAPLAVMVIHVVNVVRPSVDLRVWTHVVVPNVPDSKCWRTQSERKPEERPENFTRSGQMSPRLNALPRNSRKAWSTRLWVIRGSGGSGGAVATLSTDDARGEGWFTCTPSAWAVLPSTLTGPVSGTERETGRVGMPTLSSTTTLVLAA